MEGIDVETGEKIGFFERLKIAIFKFEDYAKLAAQKISKAVIYMLILMLVFALCVSAATTYKFSQSLNGLASYISNEIETLQFKDGILRIVPSNEKDKPIIIENEELPIWKNYYRHRRLGTIKNRRVQRPNKALYYWYCCFKR